MKDFRFRPGWSTINQKSFLNEKTLLHASGQVGSLHIVNTDNQPVKNKPTSASRFEKRLLIQARLVMDVRMYVYASMGIDNKVGSYT